MNRRSTLYICLSLMMILSLAGCADNSDVAGIESFGADSWKQYRYSPDSNAVIDSGHDPLEYMRLETKEEVRATPVVADGKVFIGNHDSGEIMAFDLADGRKIWEEHAPNWIHSEAIYHEGKVYVGYGNRHFKADGTRGTGASGVMALDAETGEEIWNYETDGEVMPTPAIYGDHLYITTGDRHLYKLTLGEGKLIHKHYLGSVVSMSSPNIYKGTLYFGSGAPKPYTFHAYDLETDEIKWETDLTDIERGLDDVPAAVDEGIAVTTAIVINDDGESEHEIYAMDTDTGKISWQDNWGPGKTVRNNKSGAPMIHDGKVFVASPKTEKYYAYDLKSGEKLWELADAAAKAPPAAKDGIVYFANTEGYVSGIDIETGRKVKEKQLGGTLAPAGPVIANDTMFVGSQDSYVYIVPLSDFEDVR